MSVCIGKKIRNFLQALSSWATVSQVHQTFHTQGSRFSETAGNTSLCLCLCFNKTKKIRKETRRSRAPCRRRPSGVSVDPQNCESRLLSSTSKSVFSCETGNPYQTGVPFHRKCLPDFIEINELNSTQQPPPSPTPLGFAPVSCFGHT